MKKIISLMMAVIMTASCFTLLESTAFAADPANAISLPLNASMAAYSLSEDDSEQYFKINVPSDGKVTVKVMSYKGYTEYYIREADSTESIYCGYTYSGSSNSPYTLSKTLALTAGDYIIKVYGYSGDYKIACDFTSFNTNDSAAYSYDSPMDLPMDYQVNGAITENHGTDWYRITVTTARKYIFKSISYMNKSYIKLYNYDLSDYIISNFGYYGYDASETSPQTTIKYATLQPGTYYIKATADYTGRYTMSWSVLTPDNCSHDYESSTVSPTYFAKGYTKYTCVDCGASYKDNYTAKLKLSKPNFYSVKKGKKKMTLSFSKGYSADGVQIQYSTSKKFKKKSTKTVTSKKTSKTIKKLKSNKKYYVRIRAYKTVNGKKVYSSWTKSKSVKIK